MLHRFADHEDEPARVVPERPPGDAPLEALRRHFLDALDSRDPMTGLCDDPNVLRFHRLLFETPSLIAALYATRPRGEEALARALDTTETALPGGAAGGRADPRRPAHPRPRELAADRGRAERGRPGCHGDHGGGGGLRAARHGTGAVPGLAPSGGRPWRGSSPGRRGSWASPWRTGCVATGTTCGGWPRSGTQLPEGVGRIVGDLRDDAGFRSAFDRRFDAVCHLAALVRARDSRADPVGFGARMSAARLPSSRPSPRRRGRPRGWSSRRRARCTASTPYSRSTRRSRPGRRARTGRAARRRPGRRRPGRDRGDRCGEPASVQRRRRAPGARGPRRDAARPQGRRGGPGRAAELVVNGDGSVVRDYVHVADMADAFARALDACRPGRWTAYNVGAGRGAPSRTSSPRWRRSRAVRCRSATARWRRNRRSCSPMLPGSAASSGGGRSGRTCTGSSPTPTPHRRHDRRGSVPNATFACTHAELVCTNAGLAPTPPRVLRWCTRVLRYGT